MIRVFFFSHLDDLKSTPPPTLEPTGLALSPPPGDTPGIHPPSDPWCPTPGPPHAHQNASDSTARPKKRIQAPPLSTTAPNPKILRLIVRTNSSTACPPTSHRPGPRRESVGERRSFSKKLRTERSSNVRETIRCKMETRKTRSKLRQSLHAQPTAPSRTKFGPSQPLRPCQPQPNREWEAGVGAQSWRELLLDSLLSLVKKTVPSQ